MSEHGLVRRPLVDLRPWLQTPAVHTQPYDMQHARYWLARALLDADDIQHPRLRHAIRRAIMHALAELGCMVCGKPFKFDELEQCDTTQRSLVHLWGQCSEQLSALTGLTVDEVIQGKQWAAPLKGQ